MSIAFVLLLCVLVGAVELNGTRESPYPYPSSLQNGEPQQIPGTIDSPTPSPVASEMSSTMYMSVIHYSCAAEFTGDPLMILYGTKSWTFPVQDVNFTLSYPAKNPDFQMSVEDEGYILTSFKVVLYIDGLHAKGYIVDGGILKDNLNLMFLCSSISSMSYEFWLYGTPRHKLPEIYHHPLTDSFQCT